MRKFVISDIHGHLNTFRFLVEQKLKLSSEDELYLLGDYVDRGPDSKGVIDYIWKLQDKLKEVVCLRGNHESMLLDSALGEDYYEHWVSNGGQETLESFEAESIEEIPAIYLNFLEELEYYHEQENYILVHAGLNFEENDPLSISEDMLWLRDWYGSIDYEWLGKRTIIHGHTPIPYNHIESLARNLEELRYLNIDCGCFFSYRSGKGRMCAFEMQTKQLFFQENMD